MTVYDRLSRARAMPGVARWVRGAYLLVRRALARVGFQLVYASYDSPIPDVSALEPAFFDRPDPMRGIEFDVEAQMTFVEQELAEYCREFAPPVSAAQAGPHRYYLRNGTYESVDAELLHAMVRRFGPRRVIEL